MGNSDDKAVRRLLNEAATCAAAGDALAAREHWLAALELCPDSIEALALLADSEADQGRHTQAKSYLEKATAIAPEQADLHNSLGLVLASLNSATAALA